MNVATARKAIVDAVLTVRDCFRAYGRQETVGKDWRSIARAKAAELRSVPAEDLDAYRETFEIAARSAAALLDEQVRVV